MKKRQWARAYRRGKGLWHVQGTTGLVGMSACYGFTMFATVGSGPREQTYTDAIPEPTCPKCKARMGLA